MFHLLSTIFDLLAGLGVLAVGFFGWGGVAASRPTGTSALPACDPPSPISLAALASWR
jgi:hypothetical protein